MAHAIDMTAKVCGQWTVLNRVADHVTRGDKRRIPHWRCRCTCGNIREVGGEHLRSGRSSRCRSCAKRGMRLLGKQVSHRHWARMQRNAKLRNYEWDVRLTREWLLDLLEQQQYTCALSGVAIHLPQSIEHEMRGDITASLDRIDNAHGYFPGNVRWVHKAVNRLRGSLSDEELLLFCQKIVAKHALPAVDSGT